MKQLSKDHEFHRIELHMVPEKDDGYFSCIGINTIGQTPFITLYDDGVEHTYHNIKECWFSNGRRGKKDSELKNNAERQKEFDKQYTSLTRTEAMFEILCQLCQFDKKSFEEAMIEFGLRLVKK